MENLNHLWYILKIIYNKICNINEIQWCSLDAGLKRNVDQKTHFEKFI